MKDLTPVTPVMTPVTAILALSLLLPTTALANKATLELVSASPPDWVESCTPPKAEGCQIHFKADSPDVVLSFKLDHPIISKAKTVIKPGSSGCDTGTPFGEEIPPTNSGENSGTFSITLEAAKIGDLDIEGKKLGEPNSDRVVQFRVCADAGTHKETTTGVDTPSADTIGQMNFTVRYDNKPPAAPTDAVVVGLHKTLQLSWKASQNESDVFKYEVRIDRKCHPVHKANEQEILRAVGDSPRTEEIQRQFKERCGAPEADSDSDYARSVDVLDGATQIVLTDVLTEIAEKDLVNDTLYFMEVFAVDRVRNNPNTPGAYAIGMPIPAIGPRDIFTDREMGCSVMPPLSRAGGVGDWSWLAFVPVLLARRRKG